MEFERETLFPANWKTGESAVALLNLATCWRVPVTSTSVVDELRNSSLDALGYCLCV